MKIKYFKDTETIFIEFRPVESAETRDLDENTMLELDGNGRVCGITIEHASGRTDLPEFFFEEVSA